MDALAALAPVSTAYASMPVADAFDWTAASRELGPGEWYMVCFRSIRRRDADEARLNAYDERAHQEAAGAPGFVHYFKGPAALDGSCLSFCLWLSRADARLAAGRPLHVEAVSLINEMYASYKLEFLRVIGDGSGQLRFEPYDPPRAEPPRSHSSDHKARTARTRPTGVSSRVAGPVVG
jgi:hypothetical protein